MAPDLTNVHAFGSVVGVTLCLGGCYFLMAVGLWNMAASVAVEGLRALLAGDPAIIVRRPLIILGEGLVYERFEVFDSPSVVSLGSPDLVKLAVKRPHREHFLAQKIA